MLPIVLLNSAHSILFSHVTKWYKFVPFLLIFFSFLPFHTIAKNVINQQILGNIVQDNKGFIWLATTNGLVRYDSENSITINNNNNNWPLPFNWIHDIALVDNDKLLLATETHKLWLFNTTTGTAQEIKTDIPLISIYKVIPHKKNYYIFSPDDKFYKVDPILKQTTLLADDINIRSLQHTKENLYISTPRNIYKLVNDKLISIETGKITSISASGATLAIAKDNKLIALSDNGTRKNIDVKDQIISLTHSHNSFSVFAINKTGKIKQYQLERLQEMPHRYPDIEPMLIKKLYHDNTGVLWVLSNQGVKQVIPSLVKNMPKLFDVAINNIALTVHQEKLILGSYGAGLTTLLPEDNDFFPENINQQFTTGGKIITDIYSLNNDVYISTFDGLWRFNHSSQSLTRLNFLSENEIILNITYKNNLLYLASDGNGVYIYDIKNDSLKSHINGNKLVSSEVIDVLPLDNSIWIATAKGINIVKTNSNNVENINSVKKVKSFGENKVIALIEYKDKVFASTTGDGFFVFNKSGELLSRIAKGVSFGYMSLINNNIWLTSDSGLYQFNIDSYHLTLIADTEQYKFTNKPVLLNGKVYAGYYGGVVEVSISTEQPLQSKIVISKTIASGKAQLLNNNIALASSNDVVTLELASLDFRPGQAKEFKYQINDGQWNHLNGNQLTLTGLSPGDYHIEIMGTNSLKQWSKFKAHADISVAYPWYWHPYSRVIYTLLIIVVIILVIWLLYLRSRSIWHIDKLLNEEIKNNVQSTTIIRRKINDIKTLITPEFNSQPNEKYQEGKLIAESHQKALTILNECLSELDIEPKDTEPSSLSGNSLSVALPYLANYFHQKYHILVSEKLDVGSTEMSYELQTAIYSIVYQAILTAINTGNGKVFTININKSHEKIWLKVTNNEQCFSQFNSKISFNMSMFYIRQITNKLNATFNTYNNQEHGSEIVISIPLMKIT